jgi:hypothetical protein
MSVSQCEEQIAMGEKKLLVAGQSFTYVIDRQSIEGPEVMGVESGWEYT